MSEVINMIRQLVNLNDITDSEINSYVIIAQDELNISDYIDAKKALAYKTLSLMGQKLWHRLQQRANEYNETLETFKDVEKWEEYWEGRLFSIKKRRNFDRFGWGVV